MCCSPEAFGFPELGVSPHLRIRRKLATFDVAVLRVINSNAPGDVRVTAELFESFRALPENLGKAVPDSTCAGLSLPRLLEIEEFLDDVTLPIPRKAVLIHQLRLGMTSRRHDRAGTGRPHEETE